MSYLDQLEEVIRQLDVPDGIRAEEIPDIGMYMDQVTTFMENRLARQKRYPEDAVLTKTMINNYTKNRLLPPPENKKYSREHVLFLIMIYYMKSFLSIGDIRTLLTPLQEHFEADGDRLPIDEVYEQGRALNALQVPEMKEHLLERIASARAGAVGAEGAEQDYLEKLFFISAISMDVYMKKQLIEHMIDDMRREQEGEAEVKKTRKGRRPKEREKSE